MTQFGKNILKSYFTTGKRPSQSDFTDLIESSLNIVDDKASDLVALDSSDNDKYITPHTARVIINPLIETKEPRIAPTTTEQSVEYFWTGTKTFKKVLDVVLTGLVTTSNVAISATDKIVDAFGKIQTQINDIKSKYRLRTQYISLNSDYILTSTNSLQKIFNLPANGAFTMVTGKKYRFKASFSISNMSTSTGHFSFGITGNAVSTNMRYTAISVKSDSTTGVTSSQLVTSSVKTARQLVIANTAVEGSSVITGVFNCTTGGLFVPSISLSGTSLFTSSTKILAGSYFEIEEIGNTSDDFNGPWS
jgi:hypothetical protein